MRRSCYSPDYFTAVLLRRHDSPLQAGASVPQPAYRDNCRPSPPGDAAVAQFQHDGVNSAMRASMRARWIEVQVLALGQGLQQGEGIHGAAGEVGGVGMAMPARAVFPASSQARAKTR